jgi:hypothetical protein
MIDLTTEAVKNQLRAMACKKYQIGLRNSITGEMINCDTILASNIENSLLWLKHENANGKDIYIRPDKEENRAIILVDDLSSIQIDEMVKRGIEPACKIETSPQNYQVWISLGIEPMPADQRLIVAKILATEFGGDKASADSNHYGRLAGFTNRKNKHKQDGKYPFVLCRASTGQSAQKWKEVREWAERKAKVQSENASTASLNVSKRFIELNEAIRHNELNSPSDKSTEAFKAYFKEWQDKTNLKNKSQNLSIGDFGVTCRMLKEGFSINDIIQCIKYYSLNITERKGKYIEDYSIRTVKAAIKKIELELL